MELTGSWWWWIAMALQAAIVIAALVRYLVLRSRVVRRTVIPQYEPPAGVDAATAALLLGNRKRAGTAAILEQAVGGAIRIHRMAHGSYRAEFRQPFAGEFGPILQLAIFDSPVEPGVRRSIGPRAVRNKRQVEALGTWTTMIRMQEILRRGPARGSLLPILGIVVGIALLFASIVISLLSADMAMTSDESAGFNTRFIFFAVSVGVSIVVLVLTQSLKRQAVVDVLAHLEGLRMFMMWAEADRLKMLQSPRGVEAREGVLHIYERLLPYAVAMGIERHWARVIGLTVGQAPYWYVDAGASGFVVGSAGADVGFSADGFAGSVGEMCDGGVSSDGGGGSGEGSGGGGIGFGGGDGGFGDGGGGGGGGDGGGGGGGGGDGGGGSG